MEKNYTNSRSKDSFFINNVKAKHVFSSLANTWMSAKNCTKLDLFYCSVNSIKSALNVWTAF